MERLARQPRLAAGVALTAGRCRRGIRLVAVGLRPGGADRGLAAARFAGQRCLDSRPGAKPVRRIRGVGTVATVARICPGSPARAEPCRSVVRCHPVRVERPGARAGHHGPGVYGAVPVPGPDLAGPGSRGVARAGVVGTASAQPAGAYGNPSPRRPPAPGRRHPRGRAAHPGTRRPAQSSAGAFARHAGRTPDCRTARGSHRRGAGGAGRGRRRACAACGRRPRPTHAAHAGGIAGRSSPVAAADRPGRGLEPAPRWTDRVAGRHPRQLARTTGSGDDAACQRRRCPQQRWRRQHAATSRRAQYRPRRRRAAAGRRRAGGCIECGRIRSAGHCLRFGQLAARAIPDRAWRATRTGRRPACATRGGCRR